MAHVDRLEEMLLAGPTPAAAAASLAVLRQLAGHGDLLAAKALASALTIALGHSKETAGRIRAAPSLKAALADEAVPPLARLYLGAWRTAELLAEPAIFRRLGQTLSVGRDHPGFLRLVRRNDLLADEALKACIVAGVGMIDFLEHLPAGGLMHVLDQAVAGGRIVPGSDVDTSFAFGREKLLATSAGGLATIILHELGHHTFDLMFAAGQAARAATGPDIRPTARAPIAAPSTATVAALAAALPALINTVGQPQRMEPRRPTLLDGGVSLLISRVSTPGGAYLHVSLNGMGDPIPQAVAADHAWLVLKLLGVPPERATAGFSTRGIFHMGITDTDLAARAPQPNFTNLPNDLRARAAAWLDRLAADGRLGKTAEDVGVLLGVDPRSNRTYVADEAGAESIGRCRYIRTVGDNRSLPQAEFEAYVRAAIRAADLPLATVLLENARQAGFKLRHWPPAAPGQAGAAVAVDREIATREAKCVGATLNATWAMLELLAANDVDLDIPIDDVGTTLLLAAARRHAATARRFLTLGAASGRANQSGETPLHAAAENDLPELVTALLDAGAAVDRLDHNRRSALFLAAAVGAADACAALLARGAGADLADGEGATPLMVAANAAIVDQLLAAGADPDAADHAGATPLLRAMDRPDDAVVSALVAGGADVDAATDRGETALHYAAATYDQAIALRRVTLLLDAGASVDEEDRDGVTPLMVAARLHLAEVAARLLDRGADPNRQAVDGTTALLRASGRGGGGGALDTARLLVARGADHWIADLAGATALDRATRAEATELADYLRSLAAAAPRREER